MRGIRVEVAAWTAFVGLPGILLTLLALGALGLSLTGDGFGPGGASILVGVLLPATIAALATAGLVWLVMGRDTIGRRVRYVFCLLVAAGQHLVGTLSLVVADQLSGGTKRPKMLVPLMLVVASGFLGGLLFGQVARPTKEQ